jgi:hypothetical protein
MATVALMSEPQVMAEERLGMNVSEGPLLAAALAAALVEYRRCLGRRDGQTKDEDGGANWRMVARLEQLRG